MGKMLGRIIFSVRIEDGRVPIIIGLTVHGFRVQG
jgi:hypothetical protein